VVAWLQSKARLIRMTRGTRLAIESVEPLLEKKEIEGQSCRGDLGTPSSGTTGTPSLQSRQQRGGGRNKEVVCVMSIGIHSFLSPYDCLTCRFANDPLSCAFLPYTLRDGFLVLLFGTK